MVVLFIYDIYKQTILLVIRRHIKDQEKRTNILVSIDSTQKAMSHILSL